MKVKLAIAALMFASAGSALAETPPADPAPAAVALLGPVLNVGNLDAELKFYVDGLGMKVLMQMGPENHKETMLGFTADARQPGIILINDATAPARPPYARGEAFNRIVLRIANLPGMVARLRAKGYVVSDVKDVAMGYRMAFTNDPEGFRIELVETVKK